MIAIGKQQQQLEDAVEGTPSALLHTTVTSSANGSTAIFTASGSVAKTVYGINFFSTDNTAVYRLTIKNNSGGTDYILYQEIVTGQVVNKKLFNCTVNMINTDALLIEWDRVGSAAANAIEVYVTYK